MIAVILFSASVRVMLIASVLQDLQEFAYDNIYMINVIYFIFYIFFIYIWTEADLKHALFV